MENRRRNERQTLPHISIHVQHNYLNIRLISYHDDIRKYNKYRYDLLLD